MRVPFLDLRRQVAELRPELEAAVRGTLDRARFVLGPSVETFERNFAAFCGATGAVGVASGTDALVIALRAIGVRPGDEVITAANTCVPTVAAIELTGATAVLADVDPVTWTLDAASVERALTSRTRALVPVHLYGQCADMDALGSLAKAHDLRIVEDAAQAHGAEYAGRRAGVLGDAAAFSFYPTKNLGALGDGGAVVTTDPAIEERARRLRNYGERGRYDSVIEGMNSRLDEIQAAMLAVKLGHLDTWNARRREIAALYRSALEDGGPRLPAEAQGRRHVYHLFVVRVPNRDAFRDQLLRAGVDTDVHYPAAVHQHAAYERLNRPGFLSESESLAREVVSLPLSPQLRDDEARHVVDAVLEACDAVAGT